MSLGPVLASLPWTFCIAPSWTYFWTLALLSFYFCLLIFVNTSFHTFSSGLWASFPGELAIPPFRHLWRSLPFYNVLRYKPNLFFSSGVHGQGPSLCLKWSLGLKTKLLLLFTNIQIVHLHELPICAKFCKKQLTVWLFVWIMKKMKIQKIIHFGNIGIYCLEIWISLLKLVAYFSGTVNAWRHWMNVIHLPMGFLSKGGSVSLSL